MKEKLEEKLMRCPRLGDEVTLLYCLKESKGLPCVRIAHCWSPIFDVEAFLKRILPPDEWRQFVDNLPKDKVVSIIELIEAAKAKK